MIRAALQTNEGPIGIIGINEENLRRMKAGMPLHIDIKEITPPGTRINRVVVHYAATYVQVIDDMALGGIPVNEQMRRLAKQLDDQLTRERKKSDD